MNSMQDEVADLALMRSAASEASKALKTLANENRLLLLCQLSQNEQCVSELERKVGITQPTLSQQLAVLRKEGLVNTRRAGKHIYYAIADQKVLTMLHVLYSLYCPQAHGVKHD